MKTKQKEQGITLVALIITIIVLIILTAVTIKSVESLKIIELAQKAGEDYAKAQEKEAEEINKIEKILKAELGEMTGKIRFGNLKWSNKQASIVISKIVDDCKIEYKIEDKNGIEIKPYEEIENGGEITNLNLGDTVTARLAAEGLSGTKYSDAASITVTDVTPPTVTVVKGIIKANAISVTVSSSDKEAGMPEQVEYKYYIKESKEENYPSTAKYTGTETNYTYQGLKQNESYDVKIATKDISGNEGIGEIKNIET